MSDEPKRYAAPDVSTNLAYYAEKRTQINDKKKMMEKRHEDELAPLKEALRLLDEGFLNYFNATQSDNLTVKGVATIYRKTRASAVIEDAATFRRHILSLNDWDLCDIRANAPMVREAIEKTGKDVPGVRYSEMLTVGVRKT